MIKAMKELNELTKKEMEPVVNRLNRESLYTERHFFKITKSNMYVKDRVGENTCFLSSMIGLIDNHAVISFSYEKIEKKGISQWNSIKYGGYYQEEEYKQVFQIMKKYWETYVELEKLDGLVFVNGNLHESWVQYFLEEFPANPNVDLCNELAKIRYGCPVFYTSYSDKFIKKIQCFELVLNEWEQIMEEEVLLSPYRTSYLNLYFGDWEIQYASIPFSVSLVYDGENYQVLFENKSDDTKKLLSMRKHEVMEYFLRLKESHRLVYMFDKPKENFDSFLYELGVRRESLFKEDISPMFQEAYVYLERFGDWEFIEKEMIVLKEKMEDAIPDIDMINNLDQTSIKVYTFQTEEYWYRFVIKNKLESVTLWGETVNFKIFCSKEKETEALNIREHVFELLSGNRTV